MEHCMRRVRQGLDFAANFRNLADYLVLNWSHSCSADSDTVRICDDYLYHHVSYCCWVSHVSQRVNLNLRLKTSLCAGTHYIDLALCTAGSARFPLVQCSYRVNCMDWHNGEPSRRPEGPQQRSIRAVVFYFVETV